MRKQWKKLYKVKKTSTKWIKKWNKSEKTVKKTALQSEKKVRKQWNKSSTKWENSENKSSTKWNKSNNSEKTTLQSEITVRITVKKQQWQTTIKNVFAVEELQMMYLNIHLQLQNKVIQ